MTNVPVSRQRAPPGPATPSARQAPGECLRVSVSGKELLKAHGLQKRGYKNPRSPGRCHHRRGPGTEGAVRGGGITAPHGTSIRLRPLLGAPASQVDPGAGEDQAEPSPPQRCWGLGWSPRAPPARACDAVGADWGRGRSLQRSRVLGDPQGPGSPAQPPPRRAGTVGGAALTAATRAQMASVPARADDRGRQHLEPRGESFQQAGDRSVI